MFSLCPSYINPESEKSSLTNPVIMNRMCNKQKYIWMLLDSIKECGFNNKVSRKLHIYFSNEQEVSHVWKTKNQQWSLSHGGAWQKCQIALITVILF